MKSNRVTLLLVQVRMQGFCCIVKEAAVYLPLTMSIDTPFNKWDYH